MADLFTTYGDRYSELLPEIITDIEKEVNKITVPLEQGSIEDNLKLQYLLENEAELKRYYIERFGEGYNTSVIGGYAEGVNLVKSDFNDAGIELVYRPDQLDFMSKLKSSDALYFTNQSMVSANIAFDSMLKWAYTGSAGSLAPFIAQIDQAHVARYGATIVNTQISNFYASVNAMSAEEADVKKFTYRGTSSGDVRDFCKKRLNKTYTLDKINEMSNGQIPNVLVSRGGYSCRHRWVPKQDD